MLMLNVVKATLWCALRTSTLVEYIYSLLGNTIAWCDEYIWRKEAEMRTARWQAWVDQHSEDRGY